jgi:transcription initiation factor TFIID subunit 13
MSAKRTGQMSKRVSFSLQSPAAPSTPTPQRVLNPYTGLPTPDTLTPTSGGHYQTPNTASPTPNCQLQIPNTPTPNARLQTPTTVSSTPTPNTSSPSVNHLQTPDSSSSTTQTGLPNPTCNPSRQPSSKHLVSRLSPNWYFNEQDTELIRAGYEPQWSGKLADTTSISTEKGKKEPATKSAMAEPRARMARHKGQMNFQNERKFPQLTGIH